MRALAARRVDPSRRHIILVWLHVCTIYAFWKHAQSGKVSHYPSRHWLCRSVMNVTRSLSHTAQHGFIQ